MSQETPAETAPTSDSQAEAASLTALSDPSTGPDLTPVGDVTVTASVEVGRRQLTIHEALGITNGSIIQLNREIDAPLDLLINGRVVARGEVVVVDNEFGLRIVEIVDGSD